MCAGGTGNQGSHDTAALTKQAVTWSATNGLLYGNPSSSDNVDSSSSGELSWSHAPVATLPNSFPRETYKYIQGIQPILNKLVDLIARDKDFLMSSLLQLADSDEFTKRLIEVYQDVPDSTLENMVNLGILRSDYMLQQDYSAEGIVNRPLQIEINTIASSFGCLSRKIGELHRYLLRRNAGSPSFEELLMALDVDYYSDPSTASTMIPENPSTRVIAFGIAMAHFLYGDSTAVVLFVVQPNERNFCDQRLLEIELWDIHGIRVEFLTLAQIETKCRLGDGNRLILGMDDGEVRDISVVYFRAGYTPDDYPTEVEWLARKVIEQSVATKCPTVAYQLVGAKRIQQRLSEPGVLERFLTSEESEQLRRCFVGQFKIGPDSEMDEATREAYERACCDGANWVLKPQREGGGNNIYGKDVSAFLLENRNRSVLTAYVLMERIFPMVQKSLLLRQGKVDLHPSVSEYGVYGVFLGDNSDSPLMNECAGYLVRTKPVGVDEGGVATGYSVLSSLVLSGDDLGGEGVTGMEDSTVEEDGDEKRVSTIPVPDMMNLIQSLE